MCNEEERIQCGLYWDKAWPLVEGCSPVSEGCERCWAAAQAYMRGFQDNEAIRNMYAGLTFKDGQNKGKWNGEVRTNSHLLDMPSKVKQPTVFAVWNDLFHEKVQDNFIHQALDVMAVVSRHTYLILTKRAERIRDFRGQLPTEKNVWYGITTETQQRANERWYNLSGVVLYHKYLSVEPMLTYVNLDEMANDDASQPDWVICGEESGKGARHAPEGAIENLYHQCKERGIPFFLKQRYVGNKLVKAPLVEGVQCLETPF